MNAFEDYQDDLLAAVGKGIVRFGFNERPKGQNFVREFPLGRMLFHLAFIPHQGDFDTTADIGIRFDQVEQWANRGNKLLTEREKRRTCTIGCELGSLSECQQKRWTIANPDDVEIVALSIVETFGRVGMPYLERFSDPERALEALVGDDPSSWLHSPIHAARAIRAVALALQLRGKGPALEVARAKSSFLESRNDPGLPSYLAFLQELGDDCR